MMVAWVGLGLWYSDELPALVRGAPGHSANLRVVSLNCAGGNPAAAAEVEAWHPDLVLLQESPPREAVEVLARRLQPSAPSCTWGPEASIVCGRGGRLTPLSLPSSVQVNASAAVLERTRAGSTITVISLRLAPPTVRCDLWSVSCWTDHAALRRLHDDQLAEILAQVSTDGQCIVGGDFNAPAGDGVFAPLRPRMRDAFAVAGTGWGDTILNELPLLRIDQVWATPALTPCCVRAVPTQNSDHRMVVADFASP